MITLPFRYNRWNRDWTTETMIGDRTEQVSLCHQGLQKVFHGITMKSGTIDVVFTKRPPSHGEYLVIKVTEYSSGMWAERLRHPDSNKRVPPLTPRADIVVRQVYRQGYRYVSVMIDKN